MKGRNIVSLLVIAAVAFVGSLFTAKDASAVPAFARQTGHACTTCHFNSFPALNSFGRAFVASGYMDIGKQGKIEDEGLSLPDTLNASLITKIRYQQTGGNGTVSGVDYTKSGKGKGEIQFPDEAALLIGGRAAENVGFLLEFNAGTPDGASFASFKMPIHLFHGEGTSIALIPYTTDAGGAGYAYEVLNTGAKRMIRTWEARSSTSAHQYVGLASGNATGFSLAGTISELFFFNVALWGPAHQDLIDTGTSLSQYLRAGITPNLGGWDLGIGIQYWGGTTGVGNKDSGRTTGSGVAAGEYETKGTAFDVQAQGDVGGMPLGVYITYAVAPKADTGSTKTNAFNTGTANDINAMAINAELGVIPNKLNLGAGYRAGQSNASSNRDDNSLFLGGKYFIAQNVQLQVNYEMFSGSRWTANNDSRTKTNGNSQLTLMLFSGF